MPLAPASSRGAFLKARLAVNGIQCAARSFGTLTLGAAGFLSSMETSLQFRAEGMAGANYQLRAMTETSIACDICRMAERILHRFSAQIGGRYPEHLALGFLGI